MDFELVPSSNPDICDFEEKEALLWKQPTQETLNEDLEEQHNKPVSPPDEIWIVPPLFKSIESYLDNIEKKTNTFMILSKNEGKIEIWGAPEDIQEAIIRLNKLNDNKLDYVEERRKNEKREWAIKTKEPGWGKPEKAPTSKKEEKKLKRREERKREEEIYKKKPEESQKFPFNVYIVFPYTEIQATIFFGDKEVLLNPVRVETKCHIWYEKRVGGKGIINIVGKTKESVEEATKRVGHLFVKTFKARSVPNHGWVLHALDPPNKPYLIRITDPPDYFYLPYERLNSGSQNSGSQNSGSQNSGSQNSGSQNSGSQNSGSQNSGSQNSGSQNSGSQNSDPLKYKLIEPVYEGKRISTVGGSKEINQNFNIDKLRENYEKTVIAIKESFLKGLEAVHLFDEEIRMRIRFGRIYLINSKNFLIPVEKLNNNVLSKSKFATCLATEEEQLKRLFEVLSGDGQQEWNGSPFREFKICVARKNFDDKKDSDDKKEELPQCIFDIKFEKDLIKSTDNGKNSEKYEGKIRLWNAVIHQKNILDINMMSIDNYSWKLNLQTATRLPISFKCPQGKFVSKLRICQQGRLVYSNTEQIRVISVCEKTKRKFWWNDNYVVEITKYEYWNLSRKMKVTGIEFPLSDEKPPKVSYGVTLYKSTWEDYFAHNSNLKVGEAPEWHPYEIMDEEIDLWSDIKRFLKVLQSNHPVQIYLTFARVD
ncbi:hypothetical protein RhiirA5_399401 [Rhizophagus irregularis]|uniref:DUF7905 domain-containing protein n=1 Tax=Rhizophagus irregularis TaxID=588596 RepID=A0A2N0PN82_9GLOM|nr:hypothetical protein RhiirA5_399401 [Rhizophagus irregularis]